MADIVPKEPSQMKGKREFGMELVAGTQGAGKTYQTKKFIVQYSQDNLQTKVRGRKVLIMDSQGEYGKNEFGKDGIPELDVKLLKLRDVGDWCKSDIVDVRRIDMKGPIKSDIDYAMEILSYVTQRVSHCLLVLEDTNKITLSVTHAKKIISSLIGLRHSAVDVIASFQSLRAIEPRLYDNSKYVRLHYVSGSIDAISNKVGEIEAFQIAHLIVKKRYSEANQLYRDNKITEQEWKKRKSFFVYVHTQPFKIEGPFTLDEFMDAARKFLIFEKRRLKEEMLINNIDKNKALENEAHNLFNEYYGNA
jgi:hypothetical protein